MESPKIILNHAVYFITKDDLQGNVAKLQKSSPNGRQQGAEGGGASHCPLGVSCLPFDKVSLSFPSFPRTEIILSDEIYKMV